MVDLTMHDTTPSTAARPGPGRSGKAYSDGPSGRGNTFTAGIGPPRWTCSGAIPAQSATSSRTPPQS
jgi:hypothetical protein